MGYINKDMDYGRQPHDPRIHADASAILRSLYGENADFRQGQYEAIEATMTQNRTLVVQRTGWGKSLVYFICQADAAAAPGRYLCGESVAGAYGESVGGSGENGTTLRLPEQHHQGTPGGDPEGHGAGQTGSGAGDPGDFVFRGYSSQAEEHPHWAVCY